VIHFHLLCDKAHEFDGWFRSGEDFDHQCAAGLVSCPFCGSTKIHKALMTPAIASSKKKLSPSKGEETQEKPQESDASTPLLSPRERAFFHAWQEAARKLRQNADYVGEQFPEEARKIHFGESKSRAIYGEARLEEVSSLLDDGISIIPLPPLPEKQN